MLEVSPTTEALARAIDVCALKQAVYSANIANANVDGYRRLEVLFDEQGAIAGANSAEPQVALAADSTVKLDEEMAAMARNALRYETLLSAYERSTGLLKAAIHEGREG